MSAFVAPVAAPAAFLARPALAPARRALPVAARRPAAAVAPRAAANDDLAAAQQCLEDGCEINDVQDILARLEARRTALDREQRHISDLIFKLAQANVKGEKSVVEEIMSAAVRLFSKGDDEYPAVGSPSPWTMDKPKKK
mmetsp:Transcript_15069/g.38569  ORF Transcript_15069/g.38569 Transcript_15069/m.38569 type:complete len:140 (+) Transcript_15069:573-992(+)